MAAGTRLWLGGGLLVRRPGAGDPAPSLPAAALHDLVKVAMARLPVGVEAAPAGAADDDPGGDVLSARTDEGRLLRLV